MKNDTIILELTVDQVQMLADVVSDKVTELTAERSAPGGVVAELATLRDASYPAGWLAASLPPSGEE